MRPSWYPRTPASGDAFARPSALPFPESIRRDAGPSKGHHHVPDRCRPRDGVRGVRCRETTSAATTTLRLPNIELRTRAEIVSLEGGDRLEAILWRDNQTMAVERNNVGHVFVMTGAEPTTRWLDECVTRDEKGFIKTGPGLSRDELLAAQWPLARAPHLLETSLPGVFAVGDVRSGNQKRVASAVGEGSTAIALVHQVLKE